MARHRKRIVLRVASPIECSVCWLEKIMRQKLVGLLGSPYKKSKVLSDGSLGDTVHGRDGARPLLFMPE